MSVEAQFPVPAVEADTPAASPATPPALGRVLNLVRKLIDYGKRLTTAVQQRAAAPGFAHFVNPFGTVDLAVILARITAGLRRAAALDAMLCRRAARGRDLAPPPIRLPAIRAPRAAQQAAAPDALPAPRPADPAEDPRLARLPTEEELAAEVRRRPIGAVIVDICRDLGIAPGHLDRAFWDEITHTIIMYGGSLVRFHTSLHKRLWATFSGEHAGRAGSEWPAAPPQLPASATGPP
jgi:hypothetical protein